MNNVNHVLIQNGTIIDVENGSSFIGTIEVLEGKIRKVYKQGDLLPTGIGVQDAEGKYIIPGLIDMHCHINEGYAPHFVAAGVTSVRNTAGNVTALKRLIHASNDAPTPRVYSADRMIDGSPGQWGPTSFGNFVTDNPEEARKEVERQVKAGAKFVKLYGWIKPDVMEAAVDEAKKYGLEVSCDLLNSKEVTALDAARMGVTWFEHASGFAQEIYKGWNPLVDQSEWSHINWDEPDKEKIKALCEQMLTYNVKLCPTLVLFDQVNLFPEIWKPNNAVIESTYSETGLTKQWESLSQHAQGLKEKNGFIGKFTKEVAKTYFEMGGTVVAGTDTPALMWTFPGMALHRELELFVEIGLSEMEALQAATSKAAQSIGLTDVGSITPGKIADLVILNENPLENIEHTKTIHRVMKGGKVYTQEEILSHIPSDEFINELMKEFMEEWGEVTV
ncbi:amidohydrolase family protein [Ornithinibacillus halotolerans]|uniref:Amidohydrolase-related domain-containing protein n=1 Tax=Ornithinibacillus halotolerans TaxID=1274357 RepID=A0A916RWE2_9BACI|nr:amidohydrolase family protein [Ornithinibacillus halotolerans]GGA72447.1 hypothetical protein GCM10008025_15300 [Ornithinibacillus halotolerans]